jgi:hypothetical protein
MAFRQTVFLPTGAGFAAASTIIAANASTAVKVRVYEILAWSSGSDTSLSLASDGFAGTGATLIYLPVRSYMNSISGHEGYLMPNGCYAVSGTTFGGGAVTFDTEL